MRKHVVPWVAALAILPLTSLNTLADLEVSTSVQIHATAEFDVPLAAHGTWVSVGSYGRCWRPAHVAVGWRPYCAGEWVWTDCGWYWASDEPWAWACYHYGSWVLDPGYGWVWVPGVEWAPAWVSWRVGGGYIGWAPLPPSGWLFRHRPDPGHFVFVGTAHFGGPVASGTLVFKDSRVFAKTSEVGGVKRENRNLGGSGARKVMVNNGPAPDMVRKASGRSFSTVSVREAMRRTTPPKQMVQGPKSSPKPQDKPSRGGSDQGRGRAGADDLRGRDQFSAPQGHSPRSGFDGPVGRGRHSGGGGHGRH